MVGEVALARARAGDEDEYLPDPHAGVARPYGLIVLTLAGDGIAAITWFGDPGVFRRFGLPRTLPSR